MLSDSMLITGLMATRDDDWIIDASVRVAMSWVNNLVVLEHHCRDDTSRILDQLCMEFPRRIHRMVIDEQEWREAEYRQRMLNFAREKCPGVVYAIIDSDEMLTRNMVGEQVRDLAMSLKPFEAAMVPWMCCWRSRWQYRNDQSPFGRGRVCLMFRDHERVHFAPKTGEGDVQIHTRVPIGAVPMTYWDREDGGVLHFQHSVWRRLVAKQALYKMVERMKGASVEFIEKRYNPTVDETGVVLEGIPQHWIGGEIGLIDADDRQPWQEKRCRELMKLHGTESFKGLDLFGVV